jgi:hypothetical protein
VDKCIHSGMSGKIHESDTGYKRNAYVLFCPSVNQFILVSIWIDKVLSVAKR